MDNNPLDIYAAVQETLNTRGWKFIMEKYAKEGDILMSKLLDIGLKPGERYTERDLVAFQLYALGRLSSVIEEFKVEATNESLKQQAK